MENAVVVGEVDVRVFSSRPSRLALQLIIGWLVCELLLGGLLPSSLYWLDHVAREGKSLPLQRVLEPQELAFLTVGLVCARMPELLGAGGAPGGSRVLRAWLLLSLMLIAIAGALAGTTIRIANEGPHHILPRSFAFASLLAGFGLIACAATLTATAYFDRDRRPTSDEAQSGSGQIGVSPPPHHIDGGNDQADNHKSQPPAVWTYEKLRLAATMFMAGAVSALFILGTGHRLAAGGRRCTRTHVLR